MRYREIQTKGILNPIQGQDDWFGLSYNMNLYRGCEHQCIYCDSRSTCYRIENFNHEVLIKINALSLLEETLPRKRRVGFIGFGSMNDPYTYAEKRYRLTGQALKIAEKYRFPVHIITKSDMVLKDKATLISVNQVKARVSFTVTTTDDDLAKKLEPGAPAPSRRLAAMKELSESGIETGVLMMPILPFIEDSPRNVLDVVEAAAVNGADYIIPSFGMTIREGQREYYYGQLERHFPGLRQKYEQAFGDQYFCAARDRQCLEKIFSQACEAHGLATKISSYAPKSNVVQLSLF